MKTPYGFVKNNSGFNVNPITSMIVKEIAALYLNGYSLGRIIEVLEKRNYSSPSGNTHWSRSVIDAILSNSIYVPVILSKEQYYAIQFEKDKRSNKNDNATRKVTRYHSVNVLSGLLFCAECGSSYRRITRSNKEVVWRCANRVEHGKRICHKSPTISEEKLKTAVMLTLSIGKWDEEYIKNQIERIEIDENSQLVFTKSHDVVHDDCNTVHSMV